MPSKLRTPHIINVLNTSFHLGTILSSADISCLPWPNHIVDEYSISSRITSCHLRMNHSVYDHIMLSTNGSCHQCAHHDISRHIMSSTDTTYHLGTQSLCQWMISHFQIIDFMLITHNSYSKLFCFTFLSLFFCNQVKSHLGGYNNRR